MTEESWKLEKDLCRCCLSEGTFKNLAEPYKVEGKEEIYSEMLLDTLDIDLTPVAGPLCGHTYTICEECILRLRDACSFRNQVQLSEKRFRDLYGRDVIRLNSKLNSGLSVKLEVPDSGNEDEKVDVKLEMGMDEDGDLGMDFGCNDDDDHKSDVEQGLLDSKKTKSKKSKAKDAPKGKKTSARGRKPKAEAGASVAAESGGEGPKKKDVSTKDAGITAKKVTEHSYLCGLCPAVYQTLSAIRTHSQTEHGCLTKYACHTCNKEFSNKRNLLKHQRTHAPKIVTKAKPQKCKICNEDVPKDMPEHLRAHGVFQCPKCSTEFTNETDLLTHTRDSHNTVRREKAGLPEKLFICDTCGTEVRGHERKFFSHLQTHGWFTCILCGKVVFSKGSLKAHKETHATKKYPCGACSYKAHRPSLILSHQRRVHMRERDVPCPLCDMKFFNENSLNVHMVRHNPVKKYECRFCHKKFPRLETKNRHEKIHTGDKKKVCRVCDARFVQKASLSYHLKKYHPEAV